MVEGSALELADTEGAMAPSETSEEVVLQVPPVAPRPTICYGRILLGEITPLLAAMKRSTPRWSSHQQDIERDPLVVKLKELRTAVTALGPDDTMDPSTFLDPFLAIIRSEDTTGPVTKSALAAVNRMLNYGLITEECNSSVSAVEAVAAAVTHARFVGTDQGADEVVLWEILTVLRTLMLGPVGHLLTNESVCEILNSSFRICFETRLSELLRNCTEDALRHMVQLLFARLPQFKDDPRAQGQAKRLKMRAGGESKVRRKGKSPRPTPSSTPPPESLTIAEVSEEVRNEETVPCVDNREAPSPLAAVSPSESELESLSSAIVGDNPIGDTASVDSGIMESISPVENKIDISNAHLAPDNCSSMENLASPVSEPDGVRISKTCDVDQIEAISRERSETNTSQSSAEVVNHGDLESEPSEAISRPDDMLQVEKEDFINAQGVKFTQEGVSIEGGALVPYGMPCVREVFRFLISLTSPTNEQNTPSMILTALNLLTVGLEVGSHHINQTPSLMSLLKDQLCRNLFMLLKPDHRLSIFMASLRICTLFCESLRTHFKFQIEMFLNKLTEIITSETATVTYAHKELALETIVQLWRIPGFITELFLNYDCDLYASNLFEDLTKVLSKNAFPVQGLYSTNLLSLEALFTVIETIDEHGTDRDGKSCDVQDPKQIPLVVAPVSSGYLLGLGLSGGFSPVTPRLKARTVLMDDRTVSREHLVALKEQKKLLAAGTDQFNVKPDKGIKFLQDNGIIGKTNDDIAVFLRENPQLCKKMIGEYVSKKKNVDILSAFVVSFEFRGLRVDEALRMFLESFRLPGEAPLISIIIEHFSSHWHTSNNEPFGKEDAAFTLAYAIIMLNVDQHNQNAKKQNIPMTLDQFRNNLRGVNDGKDFDPEMLEEIYNAIRVDEIVMPSEHTGLVKENYMWKMLLKRGVTKEGEYLLANSNIAFDRDLFAICWGPTIASLSYVFDKSSDDAIIQRAVSGFRKCASISARYGMSDVFDNLVVSLCKFTTLTASSVEAPEHVTVSFGSNKKAQLAARTVFRLVTSHGDILRDGWKNILDLLLQLFRCRLLPSSLVESEDFVETSGRVSLMRETPAAVPRVESGLLSSLYSYISLGDGGTARGTNPEDVEFSQRARTCILECHPEKLITESAFLRCDSLNELLKAMMGAGDASTLGEAGIGSRGSLLEGGNAGGLDEHSQAFLLELVVQVLVANKDRAFGVWPGVRNHIYSLLMGAAAADRQFLLERCVVAMLRLAKVLLRRPNLANPILQALRMLLLLRPTVLLRISLQVVCGLREVLSVNTDHIQDSSDWAVLFNLLECTGAGAKPPPMVNSEHADVASNAGSVSDSDVGSTSGMDSGHCTEGAASDTADPTSNPPAAPDHPDGARSTQRSRAASPDPLHNTGGWILVGREGEIEPVAVRAVAVNEWDIVHQRELGEHRPEALVQAVDTLAFLVRDRRITHSSLPCAVQACRTFVEATLNGGRTEKRVSIKESVRSPLRRKAVGRRKEEKSSSRRPKSPSTGPNAYDADESDSDDVPMTYQQVSEKLLDLMDTLHTASSHIVGLGEQPLPQVSTPSLWPQALCPLLQGIARYCCDSRTTVRNMAMTYLQRALLNHDLQALSASEWESCFNKVLFPLLAKLLQPLPGSSPASLEETRVRAATLVQKVYLRHLTPLLTLPTFTALWLTILDFMDRYLNTHRSDHLVSEVTSDAIPEILKNMLLVMETTQVFHTADGFTRLWTITWDRIDAFLPDFRHNLFRSHPPSEIHKIEVVPSECSTKSPLSQPTIPDDTGVTHIVQSASSVPGTPQELWPPAATNTAPTSPTSEMEAFVPPTLREQEAARLSLSQESLPTSYSNGIILQPPLPTLVPAATPGSLPLSSPPLPSGVTALITPASQMLSTTRLTSGSLVTSLLPSTMPHLTPSPPAVSHLTYCARPPTPYSHVMFHVEPPTPPTSHPLSRSEHSKSIGSGPDSSVSVTPSHVDSSTSLDFDARLPPSHSCTGSPGQYTHVPPTVSAVVIPTTTFQPDTSIHLPDNEPVFSSPQSHNAIFASPQTYASPVHSVSSDDPLLYVSANNDSHFFSPNTTAASQSSNFMNSSFHPPLSTYGIPLGSTDAENACMLAGSPLVITSLASTSASVSPSSHFIPTASSVPVLFNSTPASNQAACSFAASYPPSHTENALFTHNASSSLSFNISSMSNSPSLAITSASPSLAYTSASPTSGYANTSSTLGFTNVSPTPGYASVSSTPSYVNLLPTPDYTNTSPTPGYTNASPMPGYANTSSTPGCADASPTPGYANTLPTPTYTSVSPIAGYDNTSLVAGFVRTTPAPEFTTTTTSSPSSIFPLSVPSFLNPFSTEVDVESDTRAISGETPATNETLPDQPSCHGPSSCVAQDSPLLYRPASLLFNQPSESQPLLADTAASLEPPADANEADSTREAGGDRQCKPPTVLPLLLANSVLHPPPLTLLPLGTQVRDEGKE
ncbi:Golgi-specific brefeldin A-resistance guanine nucleotide exchange factor 1 isoform X2 [Procambarus clarkii]|uniref:Golgi-specific brefeldin A-resistance guanine nucleotide exchange factor 1 isoform X2 n=1 Tax=Procambarus clarkii TaxID=6728 RepID=UPI001E674D58|nr:Golgi-specific brefeldin A-resistance guanine nucleotide exchange factor 1-like isoform X2 [Procambarus clarkii]